MSRSLIASTSAATTPISSASPISPCARSSAASHGLSRSERLQGGSPVAFCPAPSGLPDPIHSGTSHRTGNAIASPTASFRCSGNFQNRYAP